MGGSGVTSDPEVQKRIGAAELPVKIPWAEIPQGMWFDVAS